MNSGLRVAVLDVGSNSVRLLVADVHGGLFLPVFRDRQVTRLFSGLYDGLLHPESLARTDKAIERLWLCAREMGARHVWAFGTSAMRDGRNSRQLVERAAKLGVELEVLSGEREAQLCYAGAAPRGRAGIIDIGGGSTELLLGVNGRVCAAASAQMGAVRLYETGERAPTHLVARAKPEMKAACEHIPCGSAERWVGLGGTITTLAAMLLALEAYDPERIEGCAIDASDAALYLDKLCAMTASERARLAGMHKERADIMPAGLSVLCAFFECSGVSRVYASDRDNLLGYLRFKCGYLET